MQYIRIQCTNVILKCTGAVQQLSSKKFKQKLLLREHALQFLTVHGTKRFCYEF